MIRNRKMISVGLCMLTLVACNKSPQEQTKKPQNLPLITVIKVESREFETTEEAIGTIEGLVDPTVSSQIAARVEQVFVSVGQTVKKGQIIAILDSSDFGLQRQEAQAEVARIEVLLANQQRTVERNHSLVDKNFISKNTLDDATAQQNALKEQLQAAKVRIASIANNSAKTRVTAPADGKVEKRIVNAGEYVQAGAPIIQIIGNQKLRAHIPLPEHVANKIKPGMEIRLRTPVSDTMVTTKIKEIKPLIVAESRTLDVIADIIDHYDWQAGASVNAQIILNKKQAVLVVPEQSVVLRPAGEVVYVINKNQAQQRVVNIGEQKNGWIEILHGLDAGAYVAVDGASYLTDQAKVKVQLPNKVKS